MKILSQVIKGKLIDFAPKLNEYGPDKIVAASGILTAKTKDFEEMLRKIDEKVLQVFHNEATRRGHASLVTSVNFYFWLEGSRILDFFFTSFPFGSYMMFSSRRIGVNKENLVIPDSIANSRFKEEYKKICERMVELYKKVEEMTKSKDYARRILPIGFISRGFFNLPLQVILGVIKEIKTDEEKKNPIYPKEIVKIAGLLEKHIKENTNYLTNASFKLAYDTNFPHPNLFKSDIDFENSEMKILLKENALEELIKELKNELKIEAKPKEKIKKVSEKWKEFVKKVQDKILVEVKTFVSLAAWNDIKRHRTVRQKVESIYHAVERCVEKWDENNFYMPPIKDQKVREEILKTYREALDFYKKLIENGIEKRDAIYVIPHGIKLGIKLLLDGYHIFDPFGFIGIRSCTTTDHEIVFLMNRITNELEKEIPEIKGLVGPKCKLGYCPERNFCEIIKKFVKDYDESLHSIFNS